MNFMEVWLIKTSFHFLNLLYLFSIVIRIHEQWFDWFDCLTYPNIKASFLNDRLHATHKWSKGLFSLVWTFMTIHRISIFNTLLSGFFKFSIFSHLLLLAVIFGLLCGSVVKWYLVWNVSSMSRVQILASNHVILALGNSTLSEISLIDQ